MIANLFAKETLTLKKTWIGSSEISYSITGNFTNVISILYSDIKSAISETYKIQDNLITVTGTIISQSHEETIEAIILKTL